MSEIPCSYHPNRQAIDKCHDCNRFICLEDKQVVNSSTAMSRTSISGVYCSTCYYNLAKSQNNPYFSKNLAGAISFVILLFFGSILLIFSLLDILSSFLLYFFFIFIALSIGVIWLAQFLTDYFTSPAIDIDRARLLHQKLIRSKSTNSPIFSSQYCMNCGNSIKSDEQTCLNCGEEQYPAK